MMWVDIGKYEWNDAEKNEKNEDREMLLGNFKSRQ